MLFYVPSMDKVITDFFTAQRNLEEVILTLVECGNEYDEFLKQLILHILTTCPHLQKLRIDRYVAGKVDSVLDYTWDEFLSLMTSISRLQTLSLMFKVLGKPSSYRTKQARSLSLNGYALTHLEIYTTDDEICDHFLRHCSKLKTLKVRSNPSGRKLQMTLKHLVSFE